MDGNTLVALLGLAVTVMLAMVAGVVKFSALAEQTRQMQMALADLSMRTRSEQMSLENRQVKFEEDIRRGLSSMTELMHRIDVRTATLAARMGASEPPGEGSLG